MRRSSHVVGFVNVPTDSPVYKSTGEGGLSFYLMVLDSQKTLQDTGVSVLDSLPISEKLTACCSNSISITLGEMLVGIDCPTFKKMGWDKAKRRLFPHAYDGNLSDDGHDQYLSSFLLAAAYMGSTGWSGLFHEPKDPKVIPHRGRDMWYATYDDLTPKGKKLYDLYVDMYGSCSGVKIVIATFLDT